MSRRNKRTSDGTCRTVIRFRRVARIWDCINCLAKLVCYAQTDCGHHGCHLVYQPRCSPIFQVSISSPFCIRPFIYLFCEWNCPNWTYMSYMYVECAFEQMTAHHRFVLKLASVQELLNHRACWPCCRAAPFIWTACIHDVAVIPNGHGLDGIEPTILVTIFTYFILI